MSKAEMTFVIDDENSNKEQKKTETSSNFFASIGYPTSHMALQSWCVY